MNRILFIFLITLFPFIIMLEYKFMLYFQYEILLFKDEVMPYMASVMFVGLQVLGIFIYTNKD